MPQPTPSSEEIADVYMRYHRGRRDEDFWGHELLYRATRDDAQLLWDVTRLLVRSAADDAELAYVAAGPLEDLLVHHGPGFIDAIEEDSRKHDRMRLALSGVWLDPGAAVYPRWYALMEKYGFTDGRREPL